MDLNRIDFNLLSSLDVQAGGIKIESANLGNIFVPVRYRSAILTDSGSVLR